MALLIKDLIKLTVCKLVNWNLAFSQGPFKCMYIFFFTHQQILYHKEPAKTSFKRTVINRKKWSFLIIDPGNIIIKSDNCLYQESKKHIGSLNSLGIGSLVREIADDVEEPADDVEADSIPSTGESDFLSWEIIFKDKFSDSKTVLFFG